MALGQSALGEVAIAAEGSSPIAYGIAAILAGTTQPTSDFDQAWRRDIRRVVAAGVDFVRVDHNWVNIETSAGVYDLYPFQRAVDEAAGLPLWITLKIVDYNNTERLPTYLVGNALDSTVVKNALNAMFDALVVVAPKVWGISLGTEVESYLGTHGSEITPFANLIASAKTKIQALWGGGTHVTCSFTVASTPGWATYNAIHAVTTVADLTYYPLNFADMHVKDANAGTIPATLKTDLDAAVVNVNGKPIFFEEFGVPASTSLNSSETVQDTWLTASYDLFEVYRQQGKLKGVSWYVVDDQPTWLLDQQGLTGNLREYIKTLGLRREDNTPKPAWFTFVARVGGTFAIESDVTLAAATVTSTATAAIAGVVTTTLDPATLVASGTADVAGQLAQTLAPATLSATGTVEAQGVAAITLADATLSATATVALAGTLGSTLDPATGVATGTIDVSGTLTQTLDAATLQADGIVGTAPIVGDLTQTLADATLTATGTVAIAAFASLLLAPATSTAAGTVEVRGDLAQTLDAAILSASGTVALAGAVSVTLDPVASLAPGTVSLSGTLTATLDNATLTATGTVTEPPIVGVVTVTLADATLSSTGTAGIAGQTTSTLADATLVASGTVGIGAQLDVALGAATLAATGQVEIAGTANVTLDDASALAIGGVEIHGTLTATLDDVTVVPVSAWHPIARPGAGAGYATVLSASELSTVLTPSGYTTVLTASAMLVEA